MNLMKLSTGNSLKKSRSTRLGTFRIYLLYIADTSYAMSKGYYIGYTGSTVEERIKAHFNEAKSSKKNTKKLNWLRTLSKCKRVLTYIILEDGIQTEQQAWEREIYHIARTKTLSISKYLKNGDEGGKGGNCTAQMREKVSKAMMGNQWNVGRKQSEETCKKKSEALKGRTFSEDTRNRMVNTRIQNEKVKREQGIFNIKQERKFSEEQVIEIFRLFNKELNTCNNISKIFNCPKATISTVLYHPDAYPDYKKKHSLITIDRPKELFREDRIANIQKVNANRITRKVVKIVVANNKLIEVYDSITIASRVNGNPTHLNITLSAKEINRKKGREFYWRFVDQLDSDLQKIYESQFNKK